MGNVGAGKRSARRGLWFPAVLAVAACLPPAVRGQDGCADLPREERVMEVVSALFGRPAVCGEVDFTRDARLSAADVSAAISLQPIPTATATEETTTTATATETPAAPGTP